jgi:hypothetical protein
MIASSLAWSNGMADEDAVATLVLLFMSASQSARYASYPGFPFME